MLKPFIQSKVVMVIQWNFEKLISLCLFAFLIFICVTGSSRGSQNETGGLSFCHHGKLYGITQTACPGGIRFRSPFTPNEGCICANGIFHTKASGNSGGVLLARNRCFQHKAEDGNFQHFIPLTNPKAPFEPELSISLWNDLEDSSLNRHKNKKSNTRISQKSTSEVRYPPDEEELEIQIGSLCYVFHNVTLINQNRKNGISCDYDSWVQRVHVGNSIPNFYYNNRIEHREFCQLPQTCTPSENSIVTVSPLEGQEVNHLLRRRRTTDTEYGKDSMTPDDIATTILNENIQLAEYRIRLSAKQILPICAKTQKLELLELSKNILKKGIPKEIMDSSLLDDAFRHFEYLYYEQAKNELEPENFDDIKYALQQCLENTQELQFEVTPTCPPELTKYHYHPYNGTRASELVSIDVSTVLVDDRKYILDKNDPIVELMWKSVDFTHALCFDDFGFFLNMHHYYENQMERLFLIPEVQNRWFRDIPNAEVVYELLLPYTGLSSLITTLDYIVGSVHAGRVYNYWLKKPITVNARKKREADLGRDPFSEFLIWDDLAYCLQTNDNPELGMKFVGGFEPNLQELNTYLTLTTNY